MLIIPRSSPAQASPGTVVRMMTTQSVDETISTVICPSGGCSNHKFTIETSAAVTGAVQLETAPHPDYAGVWSPLGTATDVATIAGGSAAGILEIRHSQIVINAVRARISTVIGGGTVTVDYAGER